MNAFTIILGCILGIIIYRIRTYIKVRYQVRKFYSMALESTMLYNAYNIIENDKQVEAKITKEQVQEILEIVKEAIEYYDIYLEQYQNEYLIPIYKDMIYISSELRRWLWVNNDK